MLSVRQERVRELLKREIGEAIRREFDVSEVGLINVNDIDLAGDLKSATVFVSIFGNADQKKHGLARLSEKRVRIQAIVASAVVLKFTPVLRFVIDETVARGNRVMQIIEELEKNRAPAPVPPPEKPE